MVSELQTIWMQYGKKLIQNDDDDDDDDDMILFLLHCTLYHFLD